MSHSLRAIEAVEVKLLTEVDHDVVGVVAQQTGEQGGGGGGWHHRLMSSVGPHTGPV